MKLADVRPQPDPLPNATLELCLGEGVYYLVASIVLQYNCLGGGGGGVCVCPCMRAVKIYMYIDWSQDYG